MNNINDYKGLEADSSIAYENALKSLSNIGRDQRISKYFEGYQKIKDESSPTDNGNPTLLHVSFNNERKVVYLVVKNERDNFASLIDYNMNTGRMKRVCCLLKPIIVVGLMHSYFCDHSEENNLTRHNQSNIGQIQFRTYDHDAIQDIYDIENTVKSNWKNGSLVLNVFNNNQRIEQEHYRHIDDLNKPMLTSTETYKNFPIKSSDMLRTIDPDHIYFSKAKSARSHI